MSEKEKTSLRKFCLCEELGDVAIQKNNFLYDVVKTAKQKMTLVLHKKESMVS
jgi:hypothetical protein